MSASTKRVFIVDDSPIVRERLACLVAEIPGVQVVGEAEIAFEAIQRIQSLKPDVVILDISMPGGSGMHVLESIKKYPSPPRVIMLTNFGYDQYREKCRSLGADYFFDKSDEFDKVTEVIQNLPASSAPDQSGDILAQ
jgi:DNA-binding NarL/FixJ family response regulator